jgi:hypothetical protein
VLLLACRVDDVQEPPETETYLCQACCRRLDVLVSMPWPGLLLDVQLACRVHDVLGPM